MGGILKSNGGNARTESTVNYVRLREKFYRASVGPNSLDTEVYCAVNMNLIGKERVFVCNILYNLKTF